MTLLTIVQDAMSELNLPFPSSIINNSNTTVRQFKALSNASGKRMMKRYDFEELIREFTFTTVAAESQGDIDTIIGSDYDRLESLTLWNRDKTRQLRGPFTPQDWQRDKGSVSTTVFDAFRFRGGKVLFTPTPAAGETVAGEYVSNEWVLATDGTTTKPKFTVDSDTSRIDEDLMTLDIKWRWLRAHGFEYAEEKVEFETRFSEETGADKSSRVIDLRSTTGMIDANRVNTPDGGFGQ